MMRCCSAYRSGEPGGADSGRLLLVHESSEISSRSGRSSQRRSRSRSRSCRPRNAGTTARGGKSFADHGGDTAASLGLEVNRRDGARIDDLARDPLCLQRLGRVLCEQHHAVERDDRHVVARGHEVRLPEWDRVALLRTSPSVPERTLCSKKITGSSSGWTASAIPSRCPGGCTRVRRPADRRVGHPAWELVIKALADAEHAAPKRRACWALMPRATSSPKRDLDALQHRRDWAPGPGGVCRLFEGQLVDPGHMTTDEDVRRFDPFSRYERHGRRGVQAHGRGLPRRAGARAPCSNTTRASRPAVLWTRLSGGARPPVTSTSVQRAGGRRRRPVPAGKVASPHGRRAALRCDLSPLRGSARQYAARWGTANGDATRVQPGRAYRCRNRRWRRQCQSSRRHDCDRSSTSCSTPMTTLRGLSPRPPMMIVGARTSSTSACCSAERERSWRVPAR